MTTTTTTNGMIVESSHTTTSSSNQQQHTKKTTKKTELGGFRRGFLLSKQQQQQQRPSRSKALQRPTIQPSQLPTKQLPEKQQQQQEENFSSSISSSSLSFSPCHNDNIVNAVVASSELLRLEEIQQQSNNNNNNHVLFDMNRNFKPTEQQQYDNHTFSSTMSIQSPSPMSSSPSPSSVPDRHPSFVTSSSSSSLTASSPLLPSSLLFITDNKSSMTTTNNKKNHMATKKHLVAVVDDTKLGADTSDADDDDWMTEVETTFKNKGTTTITTKSFVQMKQQPAVINHDYDVHKNNNNIEMNGQCDENDDNDDDNNNKIRLPLQQHFASMDATTTTTTATSGWQMRHHLLIDDNNNKQQSSASLPLIQACSGDTSYTTTTETSWAMIHPTVSPSETIHANQEPCGNSTTPSLTTIRESLNDDGRIVHGSFASIPNNNSNAIAATPSTLLLPENQTPTHAPPPDLSELSRQLSRLVLVQLPSIANDVEHCHDVIQQFIQDHITQQKHAIHHQEQFVWNYLLQRMIRLTTNDTTTSNINNKIKSSSTSSSSSSFWIVLLFAKTLFRQRVSSLGPFLKEDAVAASSSSSSSSSHTTAAVGHHDNRNDRTKNDRILALQAITAVEASLQDVLFPLPKTTCNLITTTSTTTAILDRKAPESNCDASHNNDNGDYNDDMAFVHELLQQVLPLLVDHVCATSSSSSSSPPRRSVLSQKCLQLAYTIVSAAVHVVLSSRASHSSYRQPTIDTSRRETLLIMLWNATSSCVMPVLQVHSMWIKMQPACAATKTSSHDGKIYQGTDTPRTLDIMRKSCTALVLLNWQQQIQKYQCQWEHFICVDERKTDDATIRVCEEWCTAVAGVPVQGMTTDMGSLYQTLVSPQSTTIAAAATATRTWHNIRSTAIAVQDVVTCLRIALAISSDDRPRLEPSDHEQQRQEQLLPLLRGVVAWLGQSKRHVDAMRTLSSKDAADCAAILVSLLNSTNDGSISALVSSILDVLWFDSNGLPPGLCCSDDDYDEQGIPDSVEILLDQLKLSKNEQSPSPAIRELVTRCIHGRGKSLLEHLISRNGMVSSTMDILLYFVSKDNQPRDDELVEKVGSILLDNIATCSYLRSKIISNKIDLSKSVPIELLVSKMIGVLAKFIVDKDDKAATNISFVAIFTITNGLKKHLRLGLDHFVFLVYDNLNQLIANGDAKDNRKMLSDKILAALGGAWSRCLIDSNDGVRRDGYAKLLDAIVKMAFQQYGMTLPLQLLGSVVDGHSAQDDKISIEATERLRHAAVAIIKACVRQLDVFDSIGVDGTAGNEVDVLQRLSPLLCLRRIPVGYFQLVVSGIAEPSSNNEVIATLRSLVLHLRNLMQTRVHSSNERRLAAEIAGRCLPFTRKRGNDFAQDCSSFHVLFMPAIDHFWKRFNFHPSIGTDVVDSIRGAGLSLYMACHCLLHVERGGDEGGAILFAASFALEVLEIGTAGDAGNDVDEAIIRLQSGCIEFLAICIDALTRHRTSHNDSTLQSLLVEELKVDVNGGDAALLDGASVALCLDRIWRALIEIASDGFTKLDFIRRPSQRRESKNAETSKFSEQARICVWDAFIIASQRCLQGGQLDFLANATMPWIAEYAAGRRAHHPRCEAAALQVAFTLITRTKSLDFWRGKEKEVKVRQFHVWALKSVKKVSSADSTVNGTDPNDLGAVRIAGLKLMLAVVTIDQIDGCRLRHCLAPGELGVTFSTLQGVANMDRDAQLRLLAGQVMSVLA